MGALPRDMPVTQSGESASRERAEHCLISYRVSAEFGMGAREDIRIFCGNLSVPCPMRRSISERYASLTRRLDLEFRDTESRTATSFYTGSYVRRKAVGTTTDVDVIIQLPYDQSAR